MPYADDMAGATAPTSPAAPPPLERGQRVVLRGVSWAAYERLLADLTDSHAAHLAYDRGALEVMVLSVAHERWNRRLAALFEAMAEGIGLDFENLGSITLARKDAARGCEPDSCFFVRDVERLRAAETMDLDVDPAPDLIIEIDLSSRSLDKFPIYARLGVAEIWRYAATTLTLFRLDEEGDAYAAREQSGVLPGVTRSDLQYFLEKSAQTKRAVWLREVRSWARSRSRAG